MRGEKSIQMSFRINEILAREFKSECALNRETITDVLLRAIKEYVARNKKPE